MGFTEKTDFYKDKSSPKTNVDGRLGQLPNLRGAWHKKEGGGVFEGEGLIPQCTLCFISLKNSNILENKSQVFERSDCTGTVHSDLYYNKLVI